MGTTAAWTRDRGLRAIAVVAVVSGLAYGFELVPQRIHGIVNWIIVIGLQLTTARLCLNTAHGPNRGRAYTRFWRFIAAGAVTFAFGSTVGLVDAVVRIGEAIVLPPALQSYTIAVAALFLILAMLTSPLDISSGRERLRFWLDAGTVMVGVGMLAWLLTGLTADGGTTPSLFTLVNRLVGPAGFVVVAFGVVKIALGGSMPMTRPASVLGIVTAVLEAFNTASLGSDLSARHIGWHFGLNVLTNLSFLAAVRAQDLQTRDAPPRRSARRSHSRMPYVAVVGCYVLLVWVLRHGTVDLDTWVVVGGAVVGSGLVVARQMVTFTDNEYLLRELNGKVAELAAAVEERDALARSLRHLAFHDGLTGLPNRTLFLDRLASELSDPDGLPTVVMIDLDDFKPVNDRHGHHAGDTLLRAVAERLTECVRDGDTVARLGGDEFALLLPGGVDIPPMLQRIQAAVSAPVPVGVAWVQVRASLGTATARPGDDIATLLHEADLEMYADKQLSKH